MIVLAYLLHTWTRVKVRTYKMSQSQFTGLLFDNLGKTKINENILLVAMTKANIFIFNIEMNNAKRVQFF